ncbi:hypothetical protein ASU33_05305 [Solirubrum puertoriconensis]|uniref:Outer membrane protein beta-barrel domain-containing protein n=1 Tax=Solirubrum puertoriconensis TaxID=1751427 RepID=A0A9X0HIY4_SOLP1|nr:hypothetical protein ASU33_05305 [Solirubrum puertoriconensis]
MVKSLLVAGIVFGSVASAWAQSGPQAGYVVPVAGDTIKGIIDLGRDQRNAQLCYFRPGKGAEEVIYNPRQLKAYGTSDIQFESHSLPKAVAAEDTLSRAFLENVVRGPLSLYYMHNGEQERYFVAGYRPGELTELRIRTQQINRGAQSFLAVERGYRDTLANAVKTCPKASKQVPNLAFRMKDIERVVRAYNSCANPNDGAAGQLSAKRRSHLAVAPMVAVGVANRLTMGNGKANEPYNDTYQGNTYLAGGISLLYVPGLRGSGFSVQTGLMYERNRRFAKEYSYGSVTVAASALAVDYVQLPLFARYSFGHGLVRPYAEAGGALRVVTKLREDSYGNIYSSGRLLGGHNWGGASLGAGAGLSIGRSEGRQVQLGVRAEQGGGPSPYLAGSILESITVHASFPLNK